MIIELRGIDFANKGAELMLHAIVSKIKSANPRVVLVMKYSGAGNRSRLLKLGIYTKTDFKIYGLPGKYIFAFTPLFLRRRWRYINEKEINVVLDVSGFALGDFWGIRRAARIGHLFRKWKIAGKKIILMPQAFGPFSTPALIEVMHNIIHSSSLVFARDQMSFCYLEQIGGKNKKFILAPDFTNLLKGTVPPYFDSSQSQVALIVNIKVAEMGENRGAEAYYSLITRVIINIEKLGYRPYFLMHEEKKDIKVVNIINERLADKLPVIQEDDPVHIKGMIGKSKAVFTSRYHGLVSALSQGVPCLATGWSHKYEMLLKDYNYPEGLLNLHSDDELVSEKIGSILNKSSRCLIIEKLKCGTKEQYNRSEEMWENVFNEIGIKANPLHYTLYTQHHNGDAY